jgi:hypothetical protein
VGRRPPLNRERPANYHPFFGRRFSIG